MNDVFLSVVIPIYNMSEYLPLCLSRISEQDWDDYEVICIDDCSTDDSLTIARSYERNYPELFRVYSNEQNIGQGRSRERGMELARGRYITFVDSDDYVSADYLSTFCEASLRTNADVIVEGFTRDFDGRLLTNLAPAYPWCLATYSIACAKLFKTSFLKGCSIRFSKERRGEDVFFNLSCYCHGAVVEVLPHCGYYYRLNRSSTTQTITHGLHFEESVIRMFEELDREIPFSGLSERQRDVVCYSYVANAVNALVTYAHGCHPQDMARRRARVFAVANRLFPGFEDNPLFKFSGAVGQTKKIRYSVWIVMLLYRLGLDRLLFGIVSLV